MIYDDDDDDDDDKDHDNDDDDDDDDNDDTQVTIASSSTIEGPKSKQSTCSSNAFTVTPGIETKVRSTS